MLGSFTYQVESDNEKYPLIFIKVLPVVSVPMTEIEKLMAKASSCSVVMAKRYIPFVAAKVAALAKFVKV